MKTVDDGQEGVPEEAKRAYQLIESGLRGASRNKVLISLSTFEKANALDAFDDRDLITQLFSLRIHQF